MSYAALFLCAKVIGRKQIAQLNFLDYITGITIGSIAAELATDLENMWKPLVALAVYALLTWLLTLIGKRAPAAASSSTARRPSSCRTESSTAAT